MKMHSEMSYEILKDYDLSDIVMDAVLYHHENYNGSGYPYNLKGEDIPFGARVMRIADTFTALISDRPYRRAFDMESAMQIIIDEIDCYDMEVFLAFQRLIHEESTIDVINGGKILIDVSVRDIMKK
jgi:HD-GYP domain-containing protein (c-di-GMP phosphodiesterase class II)